VTISKGEKEVWVNCFCNTWRKNWQKEFILVFQLQNYRQKRETALKLGKNLHEKLFYSAK
jgi:hypothetical protein